MVAPSESAVIIHHTILLMLCELCDVLIKSYPQTINTYEIRNVLPRHYILRLDAFIRQVHNFHGRYTPIIIYIEMLNETVGSSCMFVYVHLGLL